ncbi:hypothetical protein KIL84_004861 [Mauremys mutica]|uniref:Uncharacterized protein n=1 Tax=Mauremys mutica TaxID=74926 RepID=A0A9D3XKY4_9SAUR|nr:hypothetical protein KIL84_004861 [Mauremys mutica]
MLTGVGGFVLGLIFLAPGLLIYLKNKKGERLRAGAGHRGVSGGMWGWGGSGKSGPGCKLPPPPAGAAQSLAGASRLLAPWGQGWVRPSPLLGQGQSRGHGEISVRGPWARLGAPTHPSPGRAPGWDRPRPLAVQGAAPAPGLRAFPVPSPGQGSWVRDLQ